jgi:hypothetical protein
VTRSFVYLICLVTASIACAGLIAQTPSSVPLPKDAPGLLSLAREKNGLNSSDVRPWHIRGSFTVYDQDGKASRLGTYEEWWNGSGRYKRTFDLPKFNQTDYADGATLFRDGSQEWPDGLEMLLRESLIEPIPDSATLKLFELSKDSVSVNAAKLDCVSLLYSLPSVRLAKDYYPAYCIGSDLPALRIQSVNSLLRLTFGNYVLFQGHYVAREIRAVINGKLRETLTIDALEELQNPEEILKHPDSAKQIDLNNISLNNKAGSSWPMKLKSVPPDFTGAANRFRGNATFTMRGTLEKDGHIDNVKFVSGPPELEHRVMDAFAHSIYRPFSVLGEPRAAEIVMQYDVSFDTRMGTAPRN